MGKAASPTKRTAHGGAAGASGGNSSSSGNGGSTANGAAATNDELLLLTARPERIESTVVSRENATHLAFATSRTHAFPIAAASQYLHLLNDYCDSAETHDASGASSLLVVVGPPGIGKSSLLAHWATQRRTDEDTQTFVYEHYCGCSFDSVKLSLFLFRLINQLKLTFALRDFELPHEHDEEKLKFSFARCLEAAVGRTNQSTSSGGGGGNTNGPSSKRRTIVLILDGIDCIRTEDGGDSLSWLPNAFPAGVRIIMSATHALVAAGKNRLQSAMTVTRKPVVYDSDGDLFYDTTLPPSDDDSHTIRELRRRRVTFVVVEPLDEGACRAILERYNLTATASALSHDEQDAVVAAPGSANPLYLRLILQGQELFALESTERSAWLDRATHVRDIHGVYELLIRRWNEILLQDLNEQLHTLLHPVEAETGNEHKIIRHTTKRDVTGGSDTTNGTSTGPPHPLTRTLSMRASSASRHAATTTPDPAEVESLHVAMEQRVLLVRHTLSLLAVSRYGLSETDLQRLLGDAVPRIICQRLLELLAPHVMQIRRHDCGSVGTHSCSHSNPRSDEVVLLDLSHNQLRLLVRYGFLRDDHLRACYYKELATYFGGLDASQRRIDELPVQLERCGLWSALQATLVDIKMFQLWWSERNRQEYFAYWMVLRTNCSIHDPVDDFVRSLDEFIARENPSADHVLALCLMITAFLRAWQRIDDARHGQLALARPAPPQLSEFITSLGSFFSTAHLAEYEAKRVQSEIDALCLHADDAYVVRRWLWTQFPLVAVAFECRFLRSLLASKASGAGTLDAANGKDEEIVDSNSHADSASAKASAAASSQSSSSGGVASKKTIVLPKSLLAGGSKSQTQTHSPLKPPKRKPSLLFGTTTTSNNGVDAIADDGAFEFLSTENTELTVGSVATCEAHVMELRVRYDKLKFVAKAKRDALQTLESRLLDVRARTRAAGQRATHIDALQDQIRLIGDETLVGRQRSDYYKAILRHCEIHPARDVNAIEGTETAINKLRHEIGELTQKTQVAAYDARLAAVDSKKLHQVITDKSHIQTTALERLRWRVELLQRMMVQQNRAVAATSATPTLRAQEGEEEEEREEDAEDAEDEVEAEEGNNGSRPRALLQPAAIVDEQTTQFNRAKDKLLHKKETTLERLRKVESLKVYLGSPFKDDGVLGALRQVGINKPEEAQLYWQDQQQHAAQLEADERSLEQRVGEARDKLASLQAHLLNLKLGGSSSANGVGGESSAGGGSSGASTSTSTSASVSARAASAASSMVTTAVSSSVSGSSGAETVTTGASSTSASHNLKQLEQQLSDALVITQQKKERAARVKLLSERLHLGLQHVAHLLGVHTTQQMESVELADAVEQVVRLYLGDEGHLQSAAATNLRRKNSIRTMGMAAQSGLHGAITSPDTRSPEEKRRFNLRVSQAPQRQMNPYVDGDASGGDDAEEYGGGDEEEEGEEEGDAATSPLRTNQQDATEAVTRRADIKNRARLEVERKLRTPVTKAPRDKTTSKAATKPQKGP